MPIPEQISRKVQTNDKEKRKNSSRVLSQQSSTNKNFIPGPIGNSNRSEYIGKLVAASTKRSNSSKKFVVIGKPQKELTQEDVISALSKYKNIRNIIISDGVPSIEDYAFEYLEDLQEVRIPPSVKCIGSGAFRDCKKLQLGKQGLPDGLQSIGYYAFSGCESITKLEIPKTVTFIGGSAFAKCKNLELKEPNLPNNLEFIAEFAFYGCQSIKKIKIPPSIKVIEEKAFNYCLNLDEVELSEGLESICNNAFNGCESLRKIKIPSSVRVIGEKAFCGCKKLKQISVDETILWQFDGEEDFKQMVMGYESSLVTIQKIQSHDTQYIDGHKYYVLKVNDSKVITAQDTEFLEHVIQPLNFIIPDGVVKIGPRAFQHCAFIKNIKIPSTVTSIEDEAFSNCRNLKVELPENLQTIGDFAFCDCISIRRIKLPSNIKYIGDGAFKSCTNLILEDPNLPVGLEGIGNFAFYECISISKIGIPSTVKFIGVRAFKRCERLKEISIDEKILFLLGGEDEFNEIVLGNANVKIIKTNLLDIKEIEGYEYYILKPEKNDIITAKDVDIFRNTEVANIIIPNGVSKIDTLAFANYVCLEKIKIPSSVKYIGDSAFCGCGRLELETRALPEGLETIEINTFAGCLSISKIKIPSTVKFIKSAAFYSCSNLELEESGLPEGLKTIENCAFFECGSLKKLKIPSTVTEIGERAFGYCENLEIELPENLEILGDQAFKCCYSIKKMKIPSSVKRIEARTFFECENLELEELALPEGLESIGECAFFRCTSIKKIKIPSTVRSIDFGAFRSCKRLELEPPGLPENLETIGGEAFYGCGSIRKIKLPSRVTYIGERAFFQCKHLELAPPVLPENLNSIEYGTFTYCQALKKIKIPSNVRLIREVAFDGCTNLEEVELPNNLEFIGAFAFRNCQALKKIKIPSNIRAIGKLAFNGCIGLKEISIDTISLLLIGGEKKFRNEILGTTKDNLIINKTNPFITEQRDGIKYYQLQLRDKDVVTKIDVEPFRRIKRQNIIIPDGAKTIDKSAFENYNVLQNIVVPDSLIFVGESAFKGCGRLIGISMKGVKEISDYAFVGCSNLRKLSLPKLENFCQSSFIGCNQLDVESFDFLNIEIKEKFKNLIIERQEYIRNKKNSVDSYLQTQFGYNAGNLIEKIESLEKKNRKYIESKWEGHLKYIDAPRDTPGIKFRAYAEENFRHSIEKRALNVNKDSNNIIKLSKAYRFQSDVRNGVRQGLIPLGTKKEKRIKNPKKILDQYENSEELLLYRGVQNYATLDYMVLGGQKINTFKYDPKSLIGDIISDDSFTSTTMNERIPYAYALNGHNLSGKDTRERIVFKLLFPAGRKMVPIGNDNAEIVIQKKQKYMVVNVEQKMFENGDYREIIAIALPSSKVGIKRYQKGGETDRGVSKETAEKLYKDPRFKKLQKSYEIELGKYAYKHPRAKEGVQVALNKAAEKYKEAYKDQDIKTIYRKKFLKEKPEFSGIVGTNISDENLLAMLEIKEDISEEIKQRIERVELEAGNLREKLIAFQLASDNRDTVELPPPWQAKSREQLPNLLAHIGRKDRPKDEQEKLLRARDYQDQMGLTRTQREINYQKKHYHRFAPNDFAKSPIEYGKMLYKEDFGGRIPVANFMGKRLICGTSGTTMRLIKSCIGLGMSTRDILNFRLALMGCMLPEQNHSLYEILQGAQEVGITGGEILTTAEAMDKYINPLTEKKLRKNACKYNTLGFGKYNGYFPIEAMAEIKEEDRAATKISQWCRTLMRKRKTL